MKKAIRQVDQPRVLNLWVAICFWQCFEIERFCFVLRYKKPPLFDTCMTDIIVMYYRWTFF